MGGKRVSRAMAIPAPGAPGVSMRPLTQSMADMGPRRGGRPEGSRKGGAHGGQPQQPPPQQPPPPPPPAWGAGAEADAEPPTATVDSSFTVSSWPAGQSAGAEESAMGRLSS